MPLPAIILICVGCALIIGGAAYLAVKLVALIKAARKVGITSTSDVQEIVGRVHRLEPRFRELEQNQATLSESLRRLSDELAPLTYLKEELDRATGHLSTLKD